ncbi:MAG: TetR/AcrR family transcriptional regulator [Bacteroidales bacterium]|nr:TetR/AcrR family transcriptional regulator [Bacteroidales bacterium]
MSEKDKGTEARILEAAKKVFVLKGMDGARMQEIADEAGINKALLHYYFRSKDKLFEAVFRDSMAGFFPNLLGLMMQKTPIREKIRIFTSEYIQMIQQNPHIPMFVLHELSLNPRRIAEMIKETGINPDFFIQQIMQEKKEGTLNDTDPRHLIVNMIGLCIFPFVARPILESIVFGGDTQAFDRFIEERKFTVPDFINKALEKK